MRCLRRTLCFSQLWYKFVRSHDDYKILDIDIYDMLYVVGKLQEDIGKHVEEWRLGSLSVTSDCKHILRPKDHLLRTVAGRSGDGTQLSWDKVLASVLGTVFEGLNVYAVNSRECFEKAKLFTLAHISPYIWVTLLFISQKE